MHTTNAFIQGFVKRACDFGLTPAEATALSKIAIDEDEENEIRAGNFHKKDSSSAGRYLDTKAQRNQAFMDKPIAGTMGRVAGGLGGGLAGAGIGGAGGAGLGFLLSQLTGGEDTERAMKALGGFGAGVGGGIGLGLGSNAGAALGSQGFSKEKREKTLTQTDNNLRHRSTLKNMGHSGLNMALLGALLGGGVGGLSGAAGGGDDQLGNMLRQGLAGSAIGAIGGGISGAARGGINSLIHKETSDETHKRSRNLLAKHPVSTALPMGDVVGAIDA